MMDIRSASRARWAAAPFLIGLAFSLLVPVIGVVTGGFVVDGAFSLGNYITILGDPSYWAAFGNSLKLSAITSGVGLTFGLVLANSLRHVGPALRNSVLSYANIAANFVGVPLSFAFIIMFGYAGLFTLALKHNGLSGIDIYSLEGTMMVYCYFQIALATLLIYPGLSIVTPEIEDAARVMGVPTIRFWWRIALPILRRNLIAVFCLLFANAMGAYAAIYALMGGGANVVTVRVGELVSGDIFSDPNLANALATLLIAVLLVPVLLGQYLTRQDAHA